jgi:hypothetical protein
MKRVVAGMTITFEVAAMSLEMLSIYTGIPLVDLSIMYDDHIIRGDQ